MSKRRSYSERLLIQIDGNTKTDFYTHSDLLIANGYSRIVIGGRGPYIEFLSDQICHDHIYVPNDQKHRIGNDAFFYDEYRSHCESNVKIYHQKNTVGYADYVVGRWYVDPNLLCTLDHDKLLLDLYDESDELQEEEGLSIFDVL